MWRFLFLPLCALPACAVAFASGATPAPTPEKFQDTDHSAQREVVKLEESRGAAQSLTFGMSLVVGGTPMDAGGLPKPPFPVVLLH